MKERGVRSMVAVEGLRMSQIQCSRCGESKEGLQQAPLLGEAGEQVLSRTCAECWGEWIRAQVIILNEHKLTPANPEHFELLLGEMRSFLKLG